MDTDNRTPPAARVGPAGPDDFAPVEALLRAASLPVQGLDPLLADAVVARDTAGIVVGCAALEVYGRTALLRSVAVSGDRRGTGTGTTLVARALALARSQGVEAVYLLTTTAAAFFAARGFAVIERTEVPEVIQGTAEFASICPASATVMWTPIGPASTAPL